MAEAYAALQQRRTRVLPKTFMFPPANHVRSSRKPPPSPCKVCSSPYHWDRECPHWHEYEAKERMKPQTVNVVEQGDPEVDNMYDACFTALINERALDLYDGVVDAQSASRPSLKTAFRVTVETVRDKDSKLQERMVELE